MRTFLLSLTLVITALSLNSRRITPDEAMSAAKDFLETKSHANTRACNNLADMQLVSVTPDDSKPYHAFNISDGRGFVLVSAESSEPMILGYADKGSFDISNLPPQLRRVLASPNVISKASSKMTASRGEVLHPTAEWGQYAPFNNLCPEIEGEKAPAGCVATAMAIAMKYYNWPDYTRGGEQVIFFNQEHRFNFSDYSIDWEALEDKGNPNFADEAAKLLYSAGVASRMQYGAFESSAEVWPISHKMIELYTYAKGADFLERKKFNDEEWNNMLIKQLDEVGPVIYCGNGTGGHCFVVDGYDQEGLYHVNWGWDGNLNGYYALDFSDIGGMSFGDFQGMIINLKPDRERKEYSKSFIPSAEVYRTQPGVNGWNFFSPEIIPGEKTTFRFPFMTYNCHVGFYRIAIVDENDNILEIIPDEIGLRNADCGTYCEYPGCDFYLENVVFPPLKDGQRYQVVSQDATVEDVKNFDMSKISNDPKDFKLVLGGTVYPSYFYATGNRSDVVEVNYHVEENLPARFINRNTTAKAFVDRCLKGSSSADNLIGPYDGMQLEVKCFDKNGNPEEPVYSLDRNNGFGNLNYNISVYSDVIDAYIKYESDGNSRNDEGISSESIIEHDGLVYQKVDGGVALIGYDNVSDVLSIPANVSTEDVMLPVISIEKDALLLSDIEELNIDCANIRNINNCAFAGLSQLKSISFDGLSNYSKTGYYSAPFLQTSPDFVYFSSIPSTDLMEEICGFSALYNVPPLVSNPNSNYYVSALPTYDANQYLYFAPLYYLKGYNYGTEQKIMQSYNVPGLGETPMLQELGSFSFPVRQMWEYAIDKQSGCVSITNVVDNIRIDNLTVNGTAIEKDGDGLYVIPVSDIDNFDIVVNYTVNGTKSMSTHYTPEYNAQVASTLLKKIVAESITLSQDSAVLKVGETIYLTATVLPENATDKTVTWTSSNEAVASVDAYGNVTAVTIGDATITAACGDVTASCNVTVVPIPAEKVTISQENVELKVGENCYLSANVEPWNTTDKTVTWTSGDESVAIVSAEGIVTAVSLGSTSITAACGEASATCAVTVVATPVSGVYPNEYYKELKVGEQFTFTANVQPDNATDKTVTWTSSDESVATIDGNGTATALSVGTTQIVAHCGGLDSSAATLVVLPIPVETVSISQETAELIEGDTITLTATVLPEDATDKTVTWRSDNPSIATVDSIGNVTAISVGTTTITATTPNWKTATCAVTVKALVVEPEVILAESLSITPDVWTGEEGSTFSIAAVVLPETATDKTLLWESSDVNVATVDSIGNVSVLKEGSCVITVSTADGSELTAQCAITSLAGIDLIFSESDAKVDVYNLNGILIRKECTREDLKQLTPAIYILRQGGKVATVFINK